jgi:hypothetical protein
LPFLIGIPFKLGIQKPEIGPGPSPPQIPPGHYDYNLLSRFRCILIKTALGDGPQGLRIGDVNKFPEL